MYKSQRRDKKGRILYVGEDQLETGRYVYRYTYPKGHRKAVYSWRLTKSDPYKSGTKQDLSLREKEEQINRQIRIGQGPSDMTVCELVERYLYTKTSMTHNTKVNYSFVWNVLVKEAFGRKKIDTIKVSDAKLFLISLQKDGKGYSSVHSIRGVLRPAFQMAVEDDLLSKNPFEFPLRNVVVNDSRKREALTPEEEACFLEFIRQDYYYSRYYDAIYILFKTGLRISEFCGLTINDIKLDEGYIDVNHQLQRIKNKVYVIEKTKTACGTRKIPMTDDVESAFRRILENRNKPKSEPVVNGYKGFLFLDQEGNPLIAQHWQKYFQRVREKYNNTYELQLPVITPHVCRHTYCTNMAKAGINPKVLQYLMGHADIGTTLNTYTHIRETDARRELEKMQIIAGTNEGDHNA